MARAEDPYMNSSETISLVQAPAHLPHVVVDIHYPDGAQDWPQRLEELGFLPGEAVEVLARAQPGGDPMSIRIGLSTFALRRAEAVCVRVRPATGGSQ
jgi:ferrous iron transport protein A